MCDLSDDEEELLLEPPCIRELCQGKPLHLERALAGEQFETTVECRIAEGGVEVQDVGFFAVEDPEAAWWEGHRVPLGEGEVRK